VEEKDMGSIDISNVRSYLEQMTMAIKGLRKNDLKYSCMEEFILKNGLLFAESVKVKKGRMKECFRNAYLLADSNDKMIYVEGYAVSNACILPLYHAWCVDSTGKVYDPTWKDGLEYYGVPFDLNFVRRTILDRKYYGVIDNWENHWPLLTGVDGFRNQMNFSSSRKLRPLREVQL
jgi:hypothetical protein